MKRKTFELIETKAEGDDGWFSALASVFGNVDQVGDRVVSGAFKKTLKKWRESGRPIPVILSHQWDNPFAHVGKADPRAVMETDEGLLVQGQLDIAGNDTARQVHKLMKEGLLTGWSFGYTVPDDGEKVGEDGVNEIKEVDLFEVGPTLVGANREAQLQEVKSALDVEAPPEGNENPAASTLNVTGDPTGMLTAAPNSGYIKRPADAPEWSEEDTERFREDWQKNLPANGEVEPVESEKPATPVKPAAKDALKNEIDLLRLEIAVGKPLRR